MDIKGKFFKLMLVRRAASLLVAASTVLIGVFAATAMVCLYGAAFFGMPQPALTIGVVAVYGLVVTVIASQKCGDWLAESQGMGEGVRINQWIDRLFAGHNRLRLFLSGLLVAVGMAYLVRYGWWEVALFIMRDHSQPLIKLGLPLAVLAAVLASCEHFERSFRALWPNRYVRLYAKMWPGYLPSEAIVVHE